MRLWAVVCVSLAVTLPAAAQPFAPQPASAPSPVEPESSPPAAEAWAAAPQLAPDAPTPRAALQLKPSAPTRSWLSTWGLALAGIAFGVGAAGTALRWRQDRTRPALAAVRMRVSGSVRLGPKAHLALVTVGEEQRLLAVTETQVSELPWHGSAESLARGQYEEADEEDADEIEGVSEDEELAAASSTRRAPLAPRLVDSSRLSRFQELLRGASSRLADEATSDPGRHAAELAAETVDVIATSGGRRRPKAAGRRKARASSVGHPEGGQVHQPGRPTSVEGQVAGLKRMRG